MTTGENVLKRLGRCPPRAARHEVELKQASLRFSVGLLECSCVFFILYSFLDTLTPLPLWMSGLCVFKDAVKDNGSVVISHLPIANMVRLMSCLGTSFSSVLSGVAFPASLKCTSHLAVSMSLQ